MYVTPNFKTKKQLREALARGERVRVFSPGPFPCPQSGNVSIEGPHYPAAHTWYASASLLLAPDGEGRIVALDGKPCGPACFVPKR
jgi:hypothetical protein